MRAMRKSTACASLGAYFLFPALPQASEAYFTMLFLQLLATVLRGCMECVSTLSPVVLLSFQDVTTAC